MSDIALTGYYGMHNFGDDLFALIGGLASVEFWNTERVRIVGPSFKDSRDFSVLPRSLLAEYYSRHTIGGAALRLGTCLYSLSACTRFVYCGGSIFSFGSTGARRFIEQLGRHKQSAIGVSIGPFASSKVESQTREHLKRLKFLSVRDRHSYDLAVSYGLDLPMTLAADLAGLVPRYMRTCSPGSATIRSTPSHRPKKLGFTPCNYSGGMDEQRQFCEDFARAAATLRRDLDIEVVVLRLNDHPLVGDALLAECAVSSLTRYGVPNRVTAYSQLGVWKTVEEIRAFDAYVTARLHGAVIAYVSEVPFIAHRHHPKITDFLDDIGSGASTRPNAESDLASMCALLLTNPEKPTLEVAAMSAMAARNFTLAPWASDDHRV